MRLQATARGLLARRQVTLLCDLQLIQTRTPTQFLQVVCRIAIATTMVPQPMLGRQILAVVWLQAMTRGFLAHRQVSAAVRMQATTRGLLARRQVTRLCDLQMIQARTPA